jgi:hypothetical protein
LTYISLTGIVVVGIIKTLNAVKTGYGIQIDDSALPDGRAEHKTSAIYDIVPPATLASKHVGEWIVHILCR